MGEPDNRSGRFREKIGRVLHYEWDPIGVSDIPEAVGEYDLYEGEIMAMLVRREPRQCLVDHLLWIVTARMGLGGDIRHAEAIADRLLELRSEIEADT